MMLVLFYSLLIFYSFTALGLRMSITPLPIPSTEKSRLHLTIQGKSCVSALFRAELKKELNFYRGCSGIYKKASAFSDETVDIISEGKTASLIKFLDWIEIMTKDISERKANFQRESLIVKLLEVKWENYKGDIKGFHFLTDSPSLNELNSASNNDHGSKKIEANTMAGTDESV